MSLSYGQSFALSMIDFYPFLTKKLGFKTLYIIKYFENFKYVLQTLKHAIIMNVIYYRCTGVIEWFNCLLFDVILLLLETALAIWLAR